MTTAKALRKAVTYNHPRRGIKLGFYWTLYAQLECIKCGVRRRSDIQFMHGESSMESYEVGDEAPDPDLTDFNGVFHLYCDKCVSHFRGDEEFAKYECLAAMVDAGRLLIGDATKEKLSSQDLIIRGQECKDQLVSGTRYPYYSEGLVDFRMTFDGETISIKQLRAWKRFIDEFNRCKDSILRSRGWTHGSKLFGKAIVFAEDGRLNFRVSEQITKSNHLSSLPFNHGCT
jgi:hypothetical protein